jgi:ABC-2 type transport system ATP-binding protein
MLGRPLGDAGARRRVGFLPEHFHFQDWLSGAELLRLHGRLYGMASDALRERVPQLLARVGLENQGDKPLRDYSKGMQQRVGLAQALLNDPEILFLDEPTSGLDPLGRRLVREVIAEQRARGVTVFLNSHLLGEVEVSCDRVGFVKGGRLLEVRDVTAAADGPLEVRVRLVGPAGPRLVTHRVAQESELPRLLRELVASGLEVAEFTPLRRSLEEVFLNVVGQQP